MPHTIKAPERAQPQLSSFWEQYFSETPTCTCGACGEVAIEVDPYFPYLDDFNRCILHRENALDERSGSVS